MNFQPLSETTVTRIHEAALQILDKTGIYIEDTEVANELIRQGCSKSGDRLTIPPQVVDERLHYTPSEFILYDRQGNPSLTIGNGNCYCQSVGGTPFVIDCESNLRRSASYNDLRDLVRLIEKLEHIHILTSITTPTDVDMSIQAFIGYAATLLYSNKPVSVPGATSAKEVDIYAQLTEAVCGYNDFWRKPCLLMSILPMSPLRFPKGLGEAIAQTALLGIPISIVPLPVMGVSAPISFIGAMAQQHAENLATIVIAESFRPGLPMNYHGRLSIGDMRSGASIWGIYEVGLAGAWSVALGKNCGLPTNVYGFTSSAKTPEIQSGAERSISLLLPFLAGANIIGGAGSLADIMAASYTQLVIDNELFTWAKKICQEYRLEDEQIPLDAIDRVCKSPQGSFIYDRHTVSYLRQKRQWLGDVCDRLSFADYESRNDHSMLAMAKERVRMLLKDSSCEPLAPKESQKEVEKILQWAKQTL